MQVALKEHDPIPEITYDINYALEDYVPELRVYILSLLMGKYIVDCKHPLETFYRSRQIMTDSLTVSKELKHKVDVC